MNLPLFYNPAINKSKLFAPLNFSAIVGSSIFNGKDSANELFSKADKNLYTSKDCKGEQC